MFFNEIELANVLTLAYFRISKHSDTNDLLTLIGYTAYTFINSLDNFLCHWFTNVCICVLFVYR